ncbi:MAG: AraC family transcriptional regulator [Myxococcales bacterium]|nr:AraC family transcriptional regulator [Myxococcales bacterium]
MSTASSLVRALLESARACGVEPRGLLARAGIEEALVSDRDARIPTASYLQMFELAAAASKDASFGARVAKAIDGAAFGLLGFVVASAPSLREALLRFATYSRLLCDELSVTLDDRGAESGIVYAMNEQPDVPALFEMAMVHMVFTARRGTRDAFVPVALELRHAATPRDLPELTRAPVSFGCRANVVRCTKESLSLPLRGHNATLLSILEAHATQVLESLPNEADLLGRARQIIRALLPEGEPSLEAVAERLGLGSRTLQRRLRSTGLTFRSLVDEVRRDCALAQLERSDTSVAEVAFSLGFSDPSAFTHAFRRWTGRTPGQRR